MIYPPKPSRPINWGYRFLLIFGVMQWFSLVRALFIKYLGERVNEVAALVNGIAIIFLLMAVVWYLRRYGNSLVGPARLWMFVVAVLTLVATARGFFYGLIAKFIILDVLAFTALLSFVFIGSIRQSFEDLRRVWFVVLMLSIPSNLLALSDLAAFTTELTSGVRVARETISYRTHNSLDVVLLIGAFSFNLKRWQRTVVVFGFAQVIAMQVLYQKRLETAYYTLAALACMWTWWFDAGLWRDKLRNYVREGMLVVGALALVALAVQGQSFIPQAKALVERSTGKSDDVEFQSNALVYLMFENERLQIIFDSLSSLSMAEIWFGRGMGGGAEWAGFDVRILDTSQSEEVWASNYLPDYGFFGRRSFEVGAATPILKGGIVFWLVIYSVYFLFFIRIRQITQSLAGRLCVVIVAFQVPYAFFGGDFNVSSIFQMGNYAACLGLGLVAYTGRQVRIGGSIRLSDMNEKRIRQLKNVQPSK